MPTARIPLVGVHNQRSIDGQNAIAVGQDQRFINCIFDVIVNPVTGKKTIALEKRPGWKTLNLVEAGSPSTGLLRTDSIGSVVSAFGATNSTIYDSTTSVGAITGRAIHFSETLISNVGMILIRSTDGTGWYYAADAANTLTYTGTTHTNTTLDSLGSTAGMYSGQLVSKADIPAGTRILSVDSGTSVTLTAAATGSASGTVTKTPIAKILDADFVTTGTNISAFVSMDGYTFYASEDGFVYHSDLNSIIAWSALNKIAVQTSPDLPISIAIQDEKIVCSGGNSTEFFYNAGNASGSVLSRYGQPKHIGVQNQRSVTALEDDIYFASSSRDGDTKIERSRHLATQKVSTAAVDKMIGTASASGSDIYLSAFELGGYAYVFSAVLIAGSEGNSFALNEDDFFALNEDGGKQILEFSASAATNLTRLLLYSIELNLWFEWTGALATFVRGLGSGAINQLIASSRIDTSGKIYTINPSADSEIYADDGAAYSAIVQTSQVDQGTSERKFDIRYTLVGDVEASGSVLLEANDHDYKTDEWFTIGTFDLTQKNPFIMRGGGSYEGFRAYRLTHADNSHWRAQRLDIEYTVNPN